MTNVTYGSILVAYAAGDRTAKSGAPESRAWVAAARAVTGGSHPAISGKHQGFPPSGIPIRGAGARPESTGARGGHQSRFHGQGPPIPGRKAPSIRGIDRGNTQPDRQPSLMDRLPTRGRAWLKAGRQPAMECAWSIAGIVCSRKNSCKPTSYSCLNGQQRLGTAPRR